MGFKLLFKKDVLIKLERLCQSEYINGLEYVKSNNSDKVFLSEGQIGKMEMEIQLKKKKKNKPKSFPFRFDENDLKNQNDKRCS